MKGFIMLKKNRHSTSIKLQLKKEQVLLLVYGAREFQNNPNLDFSQGAHWALRNNEPILTMSGAKLYQLGGGWWRIMGYGYKVSSGISDKATTLQVDVRDDLRILGYAI